MNLSSTAAEIGQPIISALREQGSVRLPVFRTAKKLIGRPHARFIRLLQVHEFLTTLEAKTLGFAPSSVPKARDIGYVVETLREKRRLREALKR
jgi:hypothetical protein